MGYYKHRSLRSVAPETIRPEELPEGFPHALKRVLGFLKAYARMRRDHAPRKPGISMEKPRKTPAHRRSTVGSRAQIAAEHKAHEGEALVAAVMWLLRWLSEDGWQGDVQARKRAHRLNKERLAAMGVTINKRQVPKSETVIQFKSR